MYCKSHWMALFPGRVKAAGVVVFCVLAMAGGLAQAAEGGKEEKDKKGASPAAEEKSAEGGAGGGGPPQGPPPSPVRVDAVTRAVVADKIPVVGQLQEVRSSTVASEESGRVIQAGFEVGDKVIANKTILAKIDDFELASQLTVDKAHLKESLMLVDEAQARLERAKKDVEYITALRKNQSTNQMEMENANTALAAQSARVESVKATVEQRKAQIKRLEEKLTRAIIYAPFDGYVTEKNTEVGQWLASGAPVAKIISAGPIDAVADVPERVVNNLKAGDGVNLIVEPLNKAVVGKVFTIVPAANKAARTFPVKLRLENPSGELKAGMSVTVSIPTGKATEQTLVHQDAVLRGDLGAFVWLNMQGTAVRVPVKVLFGDGDRLAVRSLDLSAPPLMPGMQVVVEGAERLMPGFPVMVVPIAGNVTVPRDIAGAAQAAPATAPAK
jgi:RND family efflux transporter MFP subunit